jgi:hypothetical protein
LKAKTVMKKPSNDDDDDDDVEITRVVAAAMLLMRRQRGILINESWNPPLEEVCDWIEQLDEDEFFRLWEMARDLEDRGPGATH